MSSGAKAGLAIGILLAVALLLGLLFFCFRRRRKHANEDYVKADDEKAAYMEGLKRSQSVASSRTTATAPRLSLRPITQFMPDMAAKGKAMNGAVPAAALGAVGGAAAGAAASRDHNDPENPFGNHAEVSRKSQGSSEKEVGLPIQNNAAENPFGKNAEVLPQTNDPTTRSMPDGVIPAPLRIRTPTPEAGAAAGGAVAAAAGGLAAAQIAERHNAPKPLNLTPKRSVSPAASSPAVSEFSQTSVPAAAMVNGPPPSNVHRIQLDFKPSMDDELSLRAGQLVRLLHEYDDGWVSFPVCTQRLVDTSLLIIVSQALCIRLDRSQQGVAPRTCLSARPVKPRPPPGPRGPGPRGPPPGFMGPGQQRPQSPASGHGSPNPHAQGRAPRPYRPAGSQQRSMSPGPYGGGPQRPAQIPTPGSKRRSNSVSEVSSRRTSPLGPSGLNPNVQKVPMQLQAVTPPDQTLSQTTPRSTMARKPVPGQAM